MTIELRASCQIKNMKVCREETNDNALMMAVACGKEEAFEELTLRHLKVMLSVAQRILGNEAEADEVVQDAFLQLWKRAEKWDPEGSASVKTWLSRVVTNRCFDYCRRRRSVPLDDADEIVDHADSAFEKIRAKDRFRLTQSLISELPERQRAAVVHYYYEDLTGRAVAEIMGTSEGAVESLLVRARHCMRKKVETLGFVWGEDL